MISLIEDKIIEALEAAQGPTRVGYTLKTIKSYGGEFADGLERATKDFPAVLVVYGGGPISEAGGGKWKVTCRFMLVCAAGNLRNEAASRKGENNKPGSYQIALDAVKILSGQTFGLDIAELKPTNLRPLVNDKAGTQLISVYGVDIETAFWTDILPDNASIDNFITFHANWDIPAHGNVETEIPSDDTADATDHVTLEQ